MSIPGDYTIVECTCGRVGNDHADLAVILENDGVKSRGKGGGINKARVKVVCMRKGCLGAYNCSKKYVQKLPRISNYLYVNQKKSEIAS